MESAKILRAVTVLVTVAALTALTWVLPASAQAAYGGRMVTGRVYVVHGIVGRTLDVYVDGRRVTAGAAPKSIIGPLDLAIGGHTVALRSGSTDVARATVRVQAGQSVDVVAHLRSDAGQGAEITPFANDLQPVAPGKLRLAVAHVAAAPPADIKVDGKVLFSNVANGEALKVVVPGGTYNVAVVPAATAGAAILGPVDLTVKPATLTRVFAVGNVSNGSMDAVVHSLPVRVSGSGTPTSVQTGDGGQAVALEPSGGSGGLVPALGGGLVLLLAAVLPAARRRRG